MGMLKLGGPKVAIYPMIMWKINAQLRTQGEMQQRCNCYKNCGKVKVQKLSDKFIKQMQEWIAAGKKIVVVRRGRGPGIINQLMKERQLPTARF